MLRTKKHASRAGFKNELKNSRDDKIAFVAPRAPSDLKAIVFGVFLIFWHRSRKVKEMLEGIDQDLIFGEQDGIKHFTNATERKKAFRCVMLRATRLGRSSYKNRTKNEIY